MFIKTGPGSGNLIRIVNEHPHFNADKHYYYVQVQYRDRNEHLLLTDNDLDKARHRTTRNFTDINNQIALNHKQPDYRMIGTCVGAIGIGIVLGVLGAMTVLL